MSKELKRIIKQLENNHYDNKEDLIKDLIILKETILIDNNKYYQDKPKVKSIYQ